MKETFKKILIGLVCVFVGIIGTILVYKFIPQQTTTSTENKNVTITSNDSLSESISKVYDAVVVVQTYQYGSLYATGSGVVYKTDNQYGYIITNQHVIENGSVIKVTNNNKVEAEATVLGSDQYIDIAVLRVDKSFVMSTATIGDSTAVKIGDTVFAVGCPEGINYQGTVTKGILSNTDREVTVSLSDGGSYVMEVLQTDAAINPGNSGGALCNINGEVIGITSMKLVQNSIEGMGFAIPIEAAMSAVTYLEQGKEIERPSMGITISAVTNTSMLRQYNITIDSKITSGVVILNVQSGYPASNAGLQKGDVITKIDSYDITSVGKLRTILYKYSVGSKVTITYIRNGETKTAEVTLDKSA
jgi:serine protease Do